MWESEELQDDSSGWTQQEDSLFKNRQIVSHNESKMLREGEWSTHSGLFSTMLIRSPRPFLLINSLAKVESYRKKKFLIFSLGCNLYTVRKKSLIKTHHLKCFRSKECIHIQVVVCSPSNGFSLNNIPVVFLRPEKNSISKFQFDLDRGSAQKTASRGW